MIRSKAISSKRREEENIKSNSDCPGGSTDSQEEELPNHLKNCSLYNQLSSIDCPLKNKYFVFILSLRFQLKLKQISIAYLRDVCNHINCLSFTILMPVRTGLKSNHPLDRNQTKDSFLFVPFDPATP